VEPQCRGLELVEPPCTEPELVELAHSQVLLMMRSMNFASSLPLVILKLCILWASYTCLSVWRRKPEQNICKISKPEFGMCCS